MLPPEFQRHFDACNTAILPGDRVPFLIGTARVGWLRPNMVAALSDQPGITVNAGSVTLADGSALHGIAKALASREMLWFRDEAFDVRSVPGGSVLGTIDRGSLPIFGVAAEGVHVNGLVRLPDGLYIWVALRAANKKLDPGKLDHIVAGGISAGMTAWDTLIKEADEEATIPAALASTARKMSELAYAMERPEGLRLDRLHCYDLELTGDFVPQAHDGEVQSFELWPIAHAFVTVRDTDAFKFNVALVLIDLFQRLGMLDGTIATPPDAAVA